jgi:3-oxoacyl-[acyl-carrier-protein] synthase II
MSQSNAQAMRRTLQLALKRSAAVAAEIEYINAHATGTLQGDAEEAAVLRELFADRVPVSSLKGHLGHSLAACGAVEVISSILMMNSGVILPTRNLIEPDPACRGIDLVREARHARLRQVLSNNFAFGGLNTSLVISSVEDSP